MRDLRHQLESHRESNAASEKRCWEKEMALKKCQDKLDTLVKTYNGNLLQLDLHVERATALRLADWSANPQTLRGPLQHLQFEFRKEERSASEAMEQFREELGRKEDAIGRLKSDIQRSAGEHKEVKGDMEGKAARREKEDKELTAGIDEAKSKLHDLRDKRHGGDMGKLKREAETLEVKVS